MNTPKSQLSSKYLTPCRTVGLRRKSSSPRTPLGPNLNCSRSPLKCVAVPLTTKDDTPLKSIDNKRGNETPSPVRQGHTLNSKRVKSNCDNPSDTIKSRNSRHSSNDKSPFVGFITKEDIREKINTINSKIERINQLKRTDVYSKKHNLTEIRKSTEKWRAACKELVLALQEELKSRQQDVSIPVILKEHNIPCESVGFNEETEEFG